MIERNDSNQKENHSPSIPLKEVSYQIQRNMNAGHLSQNTQTITSPQANTISSQRIPQAQVFDENIDQPQYQPTQDIALNSDPISFFTNQTPQTEHENGQKLNAIQSYPNTHTHDVIANIDQLHLTSALSPDLNGDRNSYFTVSIPQAEHANGQQSNQNSYIENNSIEENYQVNSIDVKLFYYFCAQILVFSEYFFRQIIENDGKTYMVSDDMVIGEVISTDNVDAAGESFAPVNASNKNETEDIDDSNFANTSNSGQLLAVLGRFDDRLGRIEKSIEHLNRRFNEFDTFVLTFKNKRSIDNDTVVGNREEFAEFKEMARISSGAELQQFELKLGDVSYARQLKQYLKHQYGLNGKKDSNALFKILFRQFVSPVALLAFSWKGNSRLAKNEANTSQNTSFKTTFPNFVNLMDSLLTIGDCEYKREFIDKYFDSFLRSKKREMDRETARSEKNLLPRKVASRNQKRQMDGNDKVDGTAMDPKRQRK